MVKARQMEQANIDRGNNIFERLYITSIDVASVLVTINSYDYLAKLEAPNHQIYSNNEESSGAIDSKSPVHIYQKPPSSTHHTFRLVG